MNDWRKRSALVLVLCVIAAHVLAAWGLVNGMPAAPYGDESRYYSVLAQETLRVAWQPWQALPADAHAPAGWARAVLGLLALWLAGEALLHFARNPLRVFNTVRRGGHHVFGGMSPLAVRMAADWSAAGKPVLAVAPGDADCDAAISAGAAAVKLAWGSEAAYGKSGLARAASLTLASGGDLENIDAAAAAATYVSNKRDADTPPLHMLLQVNDPFLRAQIDERIDRFGRLEAVQLRLVSASQVTARRLLREHPLDRYTRAAAPEPHAWIIGMGRMGEEAALCVLRTAHYRHGRKPRLTIVDRDAERCRGSLLARWPGIERVGDVRFIGAEAEAPALLCEKLMQDDPGASAPSAIYCCLGSVETNAALAIALSAALNGKGMIVPPLYVRGRPATALISSGGEWVYGYGDIDWVAQSVLKVESTLDQLARHNHERYLAEALARGETLGARRALRPWILLPEDLKDDNRNVADHHFVKMRESQCRIAPVQAEQPAFEFTHDEIEAFADVEHVRWLAARELNGWRHGEKRDDANKVHPDMVAYAQLPEDRKELDREVVRGLPGVMREIGLAITRDLAVAVTAPRAQWAFVPAFEAAIVAELSALKTKAAGTLVLWLSPDSALSCRAAELALENGLAQIALVLGETPHTLLARLPDDAVRGRVKRLLQAAERVVAAEDGAGVTAVLRTRAQVEIALSIDGEHADQSSAALRIDANGRVLHREAKE